MARSMYTDGVVAIMHFNSSIDAYLYARQFLLDLECCYCHHTLELSYGPDPGRQLNFRCAYCNEKVAFRAEHMSLIAAQYFDVRTSVLEGRQHVIGGVLLTVLPETHPEFLQLMQHLSTGRSFDFSSSSRLNYLQKDFATRAVNSAIDDTQSRARTMRGPQPWGEALRLQTIAYGFERFERLIAPRPVEYPEPIRDSVLELVQPAAKDMIEHLLHRSEDFAEIEKIRDNVAFIAIEHVINKWSQIIQEIAGPSLGHVPLDNILKPDVGRSESQTSKTSFLSRLFRGNRKVPIPAPTLRPSTHELSQQNPSRMVASNNTSRSDKQASNPGSIDRYVWDGRYRMEREADRDQFVWDNWEGLSSLAYNCYKEYGRGVLIITGTRDGPTTPLPYLGIKGTREAVREGIAPASLEARLREYDPVTTILVIFDLHGVGRLFEAYTEDSPGLRPRDLWRLTHHK